MGALLIDSTTKGFTGIAALPASESIVPSVDKKDISPALTKLLAALKEHGNVDGPTEIVIGVFGKEPHIFSFEVENLSEIQEILQWTIGRE